MNLPLGQNTNINNKRHVWLHFKKKEHQSVTQ